MAYRIDLRKRVVGFVEEGGSKAEAARRFRVSGWCVKDWCGRSGLPPMRHAPRRRKLDRAALRQQVAHHPEATLNLKAAVERKKAVQDIYVHREFKNP